MFTADSTTVRPLPRWVRTLGVLTVAAMVPLVALGGQTTTRVAGMADPVWPTEPWYLAVNSHEILKEPRPGFLLEHTHRLAGWVTGVLALALAVAAWAYEPKRALRIGGLIALLALIVAYGSFHGAMRTIKDDPRGFGTSQTVTGLASLVSALAVIACSVAAVRSGHPGGWSRALAAVGLVGVMIQGLLGGFRVLLNVWFGPDLAIVHGCFAHVVVCTFASAVILAGPLPGFSLNNADRKRIRNGAVAGIAIVFTQLIWGALTRHGGTALAQRLHLLTAFVATAAVVSIAIQLRSNGDVKRRFGGYAFHLLVIVFLQVALGVEAYLGKFAAVGPFANLPPSQRPISDGQALTRTGHVLVGLTLLVSLVALAVRVSRARTANQSVKQSDPEAA